MYGQSFQSNLDTCVLDFKKRSLLWLVIFCEWGWDKWQSMKIRCILEILSRATKNKCAQNTWHKTLDLTTFKSLILEF